MMALHSWTPARVSLWLGVLLLIFVGASCSGAEEPGRQRGGDDNAASANKMSGGKGGQSGNRKSEGRRAKAEADSKASRNRNKREDDAVESNADAESRAQRKKRRQDKLAKQGAEGSKQSAKRSGKSADRKFVQRDSDVIIAGIVPAITHLQVAKNAARAADAITPENAKAELERLRKEITTVK